MEQVGDLVNAHDAFSAEGGLVDLVAAGHRTGVGEGHRGALRVASGLEDDDRLVAREPASRAHEPPRVADALHVDEDASRLLVLAEEVDQVGEVDVDHPAHRGEHREAHMRVDRPVEHAGAQRTALRDERDVARLGVDLQERCVEADRRADDAQAVGPDDAHRAVAQDGSDALVEQRALCARLGEAGRYDDRATDACGHALLEHVGHRGGGCRDHREVDPGGSLADALVRLQAEDRLVLGVDRVDSAPGRRHRVVHDGAAHRALGLRGADDGDRLGVEHPFHKEHLRIEGSQFLHMSGGESEPPPPSAECTPHPVRPRAAREVATARKRYYCG